MGHDSEESAATSNGGKAADGGHDISLPQGENRGDPAIEDTAAAKKELGVHVEASAPSQSGFTSRKLGDEHRPPLPPRPGTLDILKEGNHSTGGTPQRPKQSARPNLQSTVTIALSRTDIHTQSYPDGSRETYAASAETTPPSKPAGLFGSIKRFKGLSGSEGGDSASVRSYAPTLEAGGDAESLLGEVLGASQESPAWKLLSTQYEAPDPFDSFMFEDNEATVDFYREFDELRGGESGEQNEGSISSILKLSSHGVLIRSLRATVSPMAIEAKTLPDSFICWKTDLQPSWRR